MLGKLKVLFLAAAATVFGVQNWDNVPLYLFFGPPTHLRLVFVVAIAAGAGYLYATLRTGKNELRLKKENRKLRTALEVMRSRAKNPGGSFDIPPADEPRERAIEARQ
jgi:uncharacterized integral membrane protein